MLEGDQSFGVEGREADSCLKGKKEGARGVLPRGLAGRRVFLWKEINGVDRRLRDRPRHCNGGRGVANRS